MFAAEFPTRPIPTISTIRKACNNFDVNGCINNLHRRRVRQNSVLTEEVKLGILCAVEERPVNSLRKISSDFGISKSSVLRILKQYKYKSYKFSDHQVLCEHDLECKTVFCEAMFNLLNENQNILDKIIFTDEASFFLDGTVNFQNYR